MGTSLDGLRILVVDDHEDLAELIKIGLQRNGAIVDIVTGGTAAITLLDTKEFDAVVSDIRMPRCGGIEITRHVRSKLGLTIPVILVTGFVDKEEETEALSAGASAVISKPIDWEELEVLLKA